MFSLPPWLAWSVIGAVVAGWLATTIASVVAEGVEVPASLNAVFLLVAGLVADDLRRNSEERKKAADAKKAKAEQPDASKEAAQ